MSQVFDASAFLATCSGRPGVYRMFDAEARLLYVGKAKNLKKRLASYFRKTGQAPKTAALVARIAHRQRDKGVGRIFGPHHGVIQSYNPIGSICAPNITRCATCDHRRFFINV